MLGTIFQIWFFLDEPGLTGHSPLEQASSLRRLLTGRVIPQLERSVPGFIFGDLAAYPAENLILFFLSRLTAAIDSIS